MRIPDIRKRLEEIADETGIAELKTLSKHLTRRGAQRVAPVKSVPVDDAKRDEIRQFAMNNSAMSQAEIGRVFNVNPGRVSEALRGFRT